MYKLPIVTALKAQTSSESNRITFITKEKQSTNKPSNNDSKLSEVEVGHQLLNERIGYFVKANGLDDYFGFASVAMGKHEYVDLIEDGYHDYCGIVIVKNDTVSIRRFIYDFTVNDEPDVLGSYYSKFFTAIGLDKDSFVSEFDLGLFIQNSDVYLDRFVDNLLKTLSVHEIIGAEYVDKYDEYFIMYRE